jgi:hypothetical protein
MCAQLARQAAWRVLGWHHLYGPPFDIVCVERTCSLPIRHVKVDPRRATNHSAASGAESQDDVPSPCPRRQCTLRCSPSANRIPVVHCIRRMAPQSLTFPPARTAGSTRPGELHAPSSEAPLRATSSAAPWLVCCPCLPPSPSPAPCRLDPPTYIQLHTCARRGGVFY